MPKSNTKLLLSQHVNYLTCPVIYPNK